MEDKMKIDRMRKGEWNKVRSFFNVETEEGFSMKNFKLVEGINGLFVGFPSEKDKEGEYRDTIFANKELREKLNKIAIKEYNSVSASTSTTSKPVFDEDNIPF